MKATTRLIGAVAMIVLAAAGVARAQDGLVAARQLYAAASYDEALTMLDKLKSSTTGDPATTNVIEQYRAFCLLALGHRPDAERAMESIVAADPTFGPNADASPRLQSAFRDVRARFLPGLVRQRYNAAKASYDAKAYQAALDQFEAVIKLIDLPDVAAADPALADLRTVASGFRDLAKSALVPPPAPPPAAAPSPTPAGPSAPSSAPAPRPSRAYYTADDPGVTAPVTLQQDVPRWPDAIPVDMQRSRRAILDVVVGENGAVESAAIHPSIAPPYDEMLIKATSRWRYKPATKDGAPVKFRKMIQIVVEK